MYLMLKWFVEYICLKVQLNEYPKKNLQYRATALTFSQSQYDLRIIFHGAFQTYQVFYLQAVIAQIIIDCCL